MGQECGALEITRTMIVAQVETKNAFQLLEETGEESEDCPPPPTVEFPRIQEVKEGDRRRPRMLKINRKEWKRCEDLGCGGCGSGEGTKESENRNRSVQERPRMLRKELLHNPRLFRGTHEYLEW